MKKFVQRISLKFADRLKTKQKTTSPAETEIFSPEELRQARQLFAEITAVRFS